MQPTHSRTTSLSRRRFVQAAATATGAIAASGFPTFVRAAARQTGKKGGSAVYLVGQEGGHIFPSFSSLSTIIVPTVPFFNGLTKPGPDLAPVPDLAESWTISQDGKTYVFKLRQGVKWHDGQPFTAQDVKFTWEIIAHPDNKTGAQLYSFFSLLDGAPAYHTGEAKEITGVKVVDDYTLEAHLTSPSAPFFTIGTNQYIVPKHVLADTPVAKMLESPYARAPIGTGPFVFQAWNAGDSIVGKAFPDHFAGPPILDQIVLKLTDLDDNGLITALKAGEVNAAPGTLEVADALKGDDSVRLVQKPGRANQYIEFNLKKPFFQDLRVRQALSYALDRHAIAKLAWQDRAKVYNSVFPYDWWPTKRDTTLYDNDQAKAKQLLDAAGWKEGDKGVREKDGKKFSFTMQAFNEPWWQIVQQQWKAIGIDVKLQTVDWPTMSTQYYLTKVFDAVALHVPYEYYTDPHYALPGYFLSANNRNSYNNPKSDQLILAAAATNDQKARQKAYYEWQEVIAHDVPHLWLGNPDQVSVYTSNLITPERLNHYFTFREVREWQLKG